ncbi:MAG TPA: RsmD family RNA methyltransferase, partial [Candidatus Binatus sp.]|nr:RsmD family RNA methyltransferase [Candidatus Binatus sp.]
NLADLGLSDRARLLVSEVRRALGDLGRAHESFDLIFVDAPFKDDTSAEVLAMLGELELLAPGGWIVVEQSKRAPAAPPAPAAHERAFVATIGDHRIAFYRRPNPAPSAE